MPLVGEVGIVKNVSRSCKPELVFCISNTLVSLEISKSTMRLSSISLLHCLWHPKGPWPNNLFCTSSYTSKIPSIWFTRDFMPPDCSLWNIQDKRRSKVCASNVKKTTNSVAEKCYYQPYVWIIQWSNKFCLVIRIILESCIFWWLPCRSKSVFMNVPFQIQS